MYSKVYSVSCPSDKAEALMAYYDSETAKTVRESDHHVSHQMIEVEAGSYLLVSNYKDQQAADDAQTLVQKMITPLVERFGMRLEIIGAGETIREIS
ncbi:MAG: hypothetical protein AAF530_13465 [Pseudomonadota bacterium]